MAKDRPFSFEPTDCIFTTDQQAREIARRNWKYIPPPKIHKYQPYVPNSAFPNPNVTNRGKEMEYYTYRPDSNLTDLSMYMKPLKADKFDLKPNDSLIIDSMLGIMVVGGIGRYTFIKEYLHLTYHGHEFDTKEAKFLLDELKNEEYIEQTVKRIQQPFSHMISTLAQVRWVLNVKFNFDYDSIRPEANIYNEFVIDSLEMMSMLMEVEYYFGVRIDLESIEDEKILTIQDLMDYLDLKRGKKSGKNLYPNQVLQYLDVEFTPLYPSQNLFRNPLV